MGTMREVFEAVDGSAKIRAEHEQLKAKDKAWLEAEYKRSHKVSDTRGVSKANLITDILIAKYGNRAVKAAFEAIDEATFRGMGAITDTSAKARAAKDAERAAKRKGEYKWSVSLRGEHDDPEQSSQARLEDKYGDVMGTVTWWGNGDEERDKFRAETMVPGVRGKVQLKGRYASLDKAKAAVEQELGL